SHTQSCRCKASSRLVRRLTRLTSLDICSSDAFFLEPLAAIGQLSELRKLKLRDTSLEDSAVLLAELEVHKLSPPERSGTRHKEPGAFETVLYLSNMRTRRPLRTQRCLGRNDHRMRSAKQRASLTRQSCSTNALQQRSNSSKQRGK